MKKIFLLTFMLMVIIFISCKKYDQISRGEYGTSARNSLASGTEYLEMNFYSADLSHPFYTGIAITFIDLLHFEKLSAVPIKQPLNYDTYQKIIL